MDRVKIMFLFGDIKCVLETQSQISSSDLKKLAAEKFQINEIVTLLSYDDDFEDWVLLSDNCILRSKEKIKVVICDKEGKITQKVVPKPTVNTSLPVSAAAIENSLDEQSKKDHPGDRPTYQESKPQKSKDVESSGNPLEGKVDVSDDDNHESSEQVKMRNEKKETTTSMAEIQQLKSSEDELDESSKGNISGTAQEKETPEKASLSAAMKTHGSPKGSLIDNSGQPTNSTYQDEEYNLIKDVSADDHPLSQTASEDYADYRRIPDLKVIENRLSNDIKKKWRNLGLELRLTSEELMKCDGQNFQESFSNVLSLWEKKASILQNYTWGTFFNAVSSHRIQEKKVVDELLSTFIQYPSSDEDQRDEEIGNGESGMDKDLQRIIKPYKLGRKLPSALKGMTVTDCMPVHFHVIINPNAWKLQKPFEVFIVSVSCSSDVKCLFGPLHQMGVDEEQQLYEATLPIPSDFFFNNKFIYRYVISQPNEERSRKEEQWLKEDLYVTTPKAWRAKSFSEVQQRKKLSLEQFDPVIIPPNSVSRLQALNPFAKDQHVQAARNALKFYLQHGCKRLGWLSMDNQISNGDIKNKGFFILSLFESLKYQCYSTKRRQNTRFFWDNGHILEKTLISELGEAIIGLHSSEDKLYCAFIVSKTLEHCNLLSSPKLLKADIGAVKQILDGFQIPVYPLDSCATTRHYRDRGDCQNILTFLKDTSPDIRDTAVVPTVTSLCQVLIDDKDVHYEWMGALPLLHELKGSTLGKNADFPCSEKEVYELLFCGLNVSILQTRVADKPGFTEESFYFLRSYFDIDWLLPRAWICMIPIEDLHCIKDYPSIAPFACWCVGTKLNDATLSLIEDFSFVLLQLIPHIDIMNIEKKDRKLCHKGANNIMKFFEGKKSSCFLTSVHLFLFVLKKIGWNNQQYVTNCIKSTNKWIKTKHGDVMTPSKVDEELEDWGILLQINQDVDHLQKHWSQEIHSILNSRLNKLGTKSIAQIIMNDNKVRDQNIRETVIHSFLSNAQDSVVSDTPQLLSYIYKSGSTPETLVVLGGILSSMFKGEDEITLANIFWKLLLESLEIYKKCAKRGHMFKPNQLLAQKICEKAEGVLLHLFNGLHSRSVTLKELDQLMEYDCNNLEVLFNSYLQFECFHEHAMLINADSLLMELGAYKQLNAKKKKVLHLVQKILDFTNKEPVKIKDALSCDQTSHPVRELWIFDERTGNPIFLVYGLNCVPDDVTDEVFHFTSSEGCYSQIFGSRWTNAKRKYIEALRGRRVSMDTFVNELWVPVIHEFCSDFKGLSNDLNLPLEKVTELFDGINDQQVLLEELNKCCIAFNIQGQSWIRNAAQKILDYQKLTYYSKSAHTLMQLKNTLRLSGDFDILTNLLQSDEESGRITLASVDTTAKETVGVLKDIAEHPSRRLCLEVFCSCTELVEWIRKMAKNVGQLAEVVQISNQTMEGDMVKQLLSDLLVFGSAYAPLIYEISPSESCVGLVNRCKSLWDFLDKHPDLHSIAKLCNERLGEFQRIEEALTDFQKSNVEQMNFINEKGIYAVSAIPGKIHHSTEEAVHLRLRDLPSEKERKVYSLSDLKELQSRLVLVATENAENVKRFIEILLKVEHVAEVLIKLQESGYIDYTHYTLTFSCSQYKKKDIEDQISKLETTLVDWKRCVKSHRKNYPQLNYYTSQQLLDLQQELGKLKIDPHSQPSCKLMLLLLSVTSHPQPSKISRAIEVIASRSQEPFAKQTKSIVGQKLQTVGEKKLNVSTLNEKEKEIFTKLTSDDDYSSHLVLQAFENCSKDANENTLKLWCMSNEAEFKKEEDESFVPDDDSQNDDFVVTVDDPLVKELLDEEYDLGTVLEAVKISKSTNIDVRKAVLSLHLGKSPQLREETGWSLPSKCTLPLKVTVDNPRDEYLSLVELGSVLQELACTIGEAEGLARPRPLRWRIIEKGTQNVIATDDVWKMVLFLYMADDSLPLPSNEEIVVCTENTSVEEVTLLWHRAVNDEKKYRLFTLVNGEKLPYKICEEVLNSLESITQGSSDFKIAIVINSTNQSRGYISSRLGAYVRPVPPLPPDLEIHRYIMSHNQSLLPRSKGVSLSDDELQISRSLRVGVQTVISTLPGMGKSLHIQRCADILRKEYITQTEQERPHYVCIPIHGPEISVTMLIEKLEVCKQDPNNPYPQIIHFNIASSILEKIDWLLFQILILGSLADQYGNIWKKVQTQICIVECTLLKLEDATLGKWIIHEDLNMKQLPSTYSLLSLLPQTSCLSPKKVETVMGETGDLVQFDEHVFMEDGVQRVFQYLRRFQRSVSLDTFSYSKPEGKPIECLSCILRAMSFGNTEVDFDPSWAEMRNFITFLNAQLCDCERSVFCLWGGDDFKGFKKFIVRFSIVMAKEFTEPSMNIAKICKDVCASNVEELYSLVKGKSWNECAHPYLFFNQDEGHSMTFMGLWIDEQGNLIHYHNGQKERAETHYMDKKLREILHESGVQFMEEYDKLGKREMLQKLIRLLGINDSKFMTNGELDLEKIDPDESYVLTLDNLMKMLAIHMKFRCGIPVIMMGETGCGKTRLIRYLCEIQDNVFKTKTLSCLKVHGGTNEERIIQEVEKAIELAKQNEEKLGKQVYTVLFFDEVNTTEALDLIKEMICDRTLYGKPLPGGIKFAAACNPYRVHDEETLRSLQTAGLGFYLRDEERIPKLGNIPLRKLVYRVLPLPPSMNQYVYDFGTVSGNIEGKYIQRIVINQIADCRFVADHERFSCQKLLVSVLQECQIYMRNQKNECKYVSLRDVVRAMILFNFFLEKLRSVAMFKELLQSQIGDDSTQVAMDLCDITRALIYSISVCYYARLSDDDYKDDSSESLGSENIKMLNHRKDFIKTVVPKFGESLIKLNSLLSKVKFFEDEILRVQTTFLNAMNVPANIAHNAALRENVFMMVVCIENRLPLFIVGKPGSSKSLAKSIVANSMQGRYSTSKFLTCFKQIQLFPYQCNQFSTTETLIEVFEEAKAFQKRQKDFRNFASVVVLEEIGLAEDTPGLPLKVLHPYLEDGTAGIDPDDQDVKPEERVAFIGISNWALDPAKMNRGIMVKRSSPPQGELLKSAYGIAKMIENNLIKEELSKTFDALAEMYQRICKLQERETDGLGGSDEAREFFGLRDFYTMIKMLCWKCIDSGRFPQKEDFRYTILRNFGGHNLINPLEELPNPSSLISMSKLENEELNIIQSSLEPVRRKFDETASKRDNRYLLFITENQSALGILQMHLLKDETPYIFYGSSFPKDKEYTQMCVNINKIKICMERGIPVILLNYEQIYESLYDVLNQCYTELHTGRYVDLGLRSYKIKCRVNPNFRLIIIAERSRVFTQFPTALINRMEKHLLISETILTNTQQQLLVTLENWTKRFANIKSTDSRFNSGDAFVGYQKDTAATILLYAAHKLSENGNELEIMKYAKELQLQLASSDALARLYSSLLDDKETHEAFDIYFNKQEHFCISDFFRKYLGVEESFELGQLIQITTYGPLLAPNERFPCDINDIHLYHISEFDTEIDFCVMLSEHFEADKSDPRLLIIQCEWERWNTDLIACARHRVQDETIKVTSKGVTHVLFVVRLARVTGGSSFTSFQGYPWLCVHIDDLTSPQGVNEILRFALTQPIHSFFQFLIDRDSEVPSMFKVCNRIKENIQISLAKTVSYSTYKQMENLIQVLFTLIDDSFETESSPSFTSCLLSRIQKILQQKDEETLTPPDTWAVDVALDKSKLQTNLTLVNSIKRIFDIHLQKIFSYIIIQLDINQNIILFASSTNLWLKRLWLNLFGRESFFQLNYQDTFVPSSASLRGHNFCCKFPFSWEVIDQINDVFNQMINHNEDERTSMHHIFCSLVSTLKCQTFAEPINSIPPESSGEFFEFYLHDYLLSLNLPFENVQSALKILHKAVTSVSVLLEPAIEQNSPYPLLNGIASIHLAYSSMEKEVYYFTELSARNPELPSRVMSLDCISSGKVIFHILAMREVIQKISPNKKDWNAITVKKWLHSYHEIRNVVETIINLQDEHDEQTQQIINSCRVEWQKTQALVLLAEHVVVNLTHTDLYVFLKRYFNILKNLSFTQPDILTMTLGLIQAIIKKLPVNQQPKCELCQENLKLKSVVYLPCGNNHMLCESCFKESLRRRGPRCPCCNEPIPRKEKFEIPEVKKKEFQILRSAQQNCMDFFMELISQCCFSSLLNSETPSDDFLEQLLKVITDTENEEYGQLFPLDEECSHSCPIARSVLLQELLERNPEKVKKKLQEYLSFIKSHGYISDDEQLTLLCIKSIEDGLHKQCLLRSSIDDKIDFALQCLSMAFKQTLSRGDLIKEYRTAIPIEYMECIAQVRFGLCFASTMFYNYYCNQDALQNLPSSAKVRLDNLRLEVKAVIRDGVIKEPRDFLLKQFVRQFGFTYLDILVKQENFKGWIIEAAEGEVQVHDELVVCGLKYTTLRSKWCFTDDTIEASEELHENPTENHVTVCLTLFRRLLTQSSECTLPSILTDMRKEIKSLLGFNEQFLEIILGRECDSPSLPTMIFSPWETRTTTKLTTIVVHFAAVVATRSINSCGIFNPFINIIKDSTDLKDCFWPAMPDNVLDIAMAAVHEVDGIWDIGSWWQCENGHYYFIGDCGNPIDDGQEGKEIKYMRCNECGVPIGGKNLRKDKQVKDRSGRTRPGHCLDPSTRRSTVPTPQRDLSPVSNCIILILINASCIWAASSLKPKKYESLVQSVHSSEILSEEVLTFFWNHLERDMEALGRATQLSFDDCILAIHSIIHNMLGKEVDPSNMDAPLKSREQRQAWEKEFDKVYIQPMTTDLESTVQAARDKIIDDCNKDHKKLYQMIYEKENYDATTKIDPHLWIYRPIITIDHVAKSLQQLRDVVKAEDLTILDEFLRNVDHLVALQYLPDIVQMQSNLYEICNHRIDEHEAQKMSMESFIQTYIPKIHQQRKLRKEVESFCKAWNSVKEQLPKLMMVDLDQKYALVEMTPSQPLTHFIPMSEGRGVCSIALATYLAKLQNDFIETSWKKLAKTEHATFKVPIQRIQKSQMINFEQQLTNVIFSHCKYSLKAGHGADVMYDFAALEKHILDRFVRGKPLIDISIPGMSYRSDVIEALTFRKIRRTIKQEQLSHRDKEDILLVVRRNQCLQECIDVVNVTLGFIQYGQWQPHFMLRHCFATIKLEKRLPKIIEDRCEVKHLISLWRILNVEQARQLTIGREDPFNDVKLAFKEDLDQKQEELLKKELKPYDIDQFLEVFYEFIATHVKNRNETEAEDMLKDAYIDVCDYFELEKIKGFEEKFPLEFSMKHMVSIWKHAVYYQQCQHQRNI